MTHWIAKSRRRIREQRPAPSTIAESLPWRGWGQVPLAKTTSASHRLALFREVLQWVLEVKLKTVSVFYTGRE